jgi:hypothetical protein
MNLTRCYPRSVHEKLAGIVQLARTLDKARAYNAGLLGEYHYDCPMDQELFNFLGTDHVQFARKAAELEDAEMERWVHDMFLSRKNPREIRAWNDSWAAHGPEPGSDGERHFLDLRGRIAPQRTDVTSWADLLDLEEGRIVHNRRAA